MPVADSSHLTFQHDGCDEGRRALRLQKQRAKESYTGKVGSVMNDGNAPVERYSHGPTPTSNTPSSTGHGYGRSNLNIARGNSGVEGGVGDALGFGNSAYSSPAKGRGRGFRNNGEPHEVTGKISSGPPPSVRSGATTPMGRAFQGQHEAPSASNELIQVRPQVKRHCFEVEVVSKVGPILDMDVNEKRRIITWICEGEAGPESVTAMVPRSFDMGALQLRDDFSRGKCQVVIPAQGGVF